MCKVAIQIVVSNRKTERIVVQYEILKSRVSCMNACLLMFELVGWSVGRLVGRLAGWKVHLLGRPINNACVHSWTTQLNYHFNVRQIHTHLLVGR